MDTDAGVVEVSWQSDRRRYATAVREFPFFRTFRRRSRWFLVAGLAVLVVGFVLRSPGEYRASLVLRVGVGWLVGVALVYLWFFFIRYLILRQVTDRTTQWRFDHAGIRMQGHVAVEAPWTEVHSWYVAGDHLIILPRNHIGRRPQNGIGVAAPVEAFSEAELARTRLMLQDHVGPEST
jgi:hypothetical protein